MIMYKITQKTTKMHKITQTTTKYTKSSTGYHVLWSEEKQLEIREDEDLPGDDWINETLQVQYVYND
jgi:ribosome maturation protein Sdo1